VLSKFKISQIILSTVLLSFSLVSFAQSIDVTAKPVRGADHISILSESGYDAKSCAASPMRENENGELVKRCEAVGWPKRGEPLRVINTVPLMYNGKHVTYLFVEYKRSNGQYVTGYVSADLTTLYDDYKTEAEEEPCKDCRSPLQAADKEIRQAQNLQRAIEQVEPKTPNPVVDKVKLSKNFDRACHNFITSDGKLGPWGLLGIKALGDVDRGYIKNTGRSCFYDDLIMNDLCPAFKKFTKSEKNLYWGHVLASIAMDESTCNPNAQNRKGTNGIADGLFQLEYSKTLRYHRDPDFCKAKEAYPTTKFDFQMECTASIIRDIHCERDRRLTYELGYWHKLRQPPREKKDRDIVALIKEFPLCKRK
jgi:hypothetical protein